MIADNENGGAFITSLPTDSVAMTPSNYTNNSNPGLEPVTALVTMVECDSLALVALPTDEETEYSENNLQLAIYEQFEATLQPGFQSLSIASIS